MNSLLWDLREAFRGLIKNPGLVFVCVLSLGLGIGMNLVLFSGLSAVFFNRATIADPEAVVGVEPGNSNQFSYLNYRDLVDAGIFEGVVGCRPTGISVRSGGTTTEVAGLAVSGNFFTGLGVRARLGRTFTDAEAVPERQSQLVVASDRFWRHHLDANPNAVGATVNLNGKPYILIGVLASSYRAPTPVAAPDLYVPLDVLGPTNLEQRQNSNGLVVIGRVKNGSSIQQVRSQLNAYGRRQEQTYPQDNRGMSDPAEVFPASELRVRGMPNELSMIGSMLMALFALVLLVACGNVAGLLMVRGAGRRQEIAMRFALGANRWRVIQALLLESFLLAAAGAAAAGLLVLWIVPALGSFGLPGMSSATLDMRADIPLTGFAILITFVTALVCGMLPALRSTAGKLTTEIQKGSTRTVTGHLRLRHAFVVAQVSISLVLLVVASLFLQSLLHVSSADPGFDVAHGVVIRVPAASIPTGQQVESSNRIIERITRVPGVRSASAAMLVPLGNDLRGERFGVDGHPERRARTNVNSVGPRYFDTMGIPLLRGRDFQSGDRPGTPSVVIVSESFARAYFPGEDALARTVTIFDADSAAAIIGIVKDHTYRNRGGAVEPVLYRAYTQIPNLSTQPRPLIINVRTERTADQAIQGIRRAMAEIDPNGPALVVPLSEATNLEIVMRKVIALLLATAGGLGLLLAMIGLYGVMAYVVTSRTAEIAIQMALGASPQHLLWGVLGRGLNLLLIGLAIGSGLALAATRPLGALLSGLSPSDPLAFVGTAVVLTLVGLVASYFPARKATRVDPMVALRQQ